MNSPSLVRLQRTGFRITNRLLNRFGLLLSKPAFIHGSPAFSGATLWARRLNQMRPYYDLVRDVEGGVVESGVHWGYGLLIFLTLAADDNRHIYGFDSFAGHSTPHEKDVSGGRYQPLDSSFSVAEVDVWRTMQLGTGMLRSDIEKRVELIHGWIQETMPKFRAIGKSSRTKIALVHADCDIYEPFKATLVNTWDLIQPGGIVILGLLNNPELMGKTRAIEEFLATVPKSSYELKAHRILDNSGNRIDASYLVKVSA